jgi:uroporphyrinogen III methyltransferase/synthase
VTALESATELQGVSVLLPRAREARDVVPAGLEHRGARVDVLPVYENVKPATHPEDALVAQLSRRLARNAASRR